MIIWFHSYNNKKCLNWKLVWQTPQSTLKLITWSTLTAKTCLICRLVWYSYYCTNTLIRIKIFLATLLLYILFIINKSNSAHRELIEYGSDGSPLIPLGKSAKQRIKHKRNIDRGSKGKHPIVNLTENAKYFPFFSFLFFSFFFDRVLVFKFYIPLRFFFLLALQGISPWLNSVNASGSRFWLFLGSGPKGPMSRRTQGWTVTSVYSFVCTSSPPLPMTLDSIISLEAQIPASRPKSQPV